MYALSGGRGHLQPPAPVTATKPRQARWPGHEEKKNYPHGYRSHAVRLGAASARAGLYSRLVWRLLLGWPDAQRISLGALLAGCE